LRALIVVTGDQTVGLGHLNRTFALGKILLQLGWDVAATADNQTMESFWRNNHIRIVTIDDWAAIKTQPSVVIFDRGREINDTEAIRRQLRHIKSVVIDDFGMIPTDASIVVNHNFFANEVVPKGAEGQILLLGPRYALVDPNLRSCGGTCGHHSERQVLLAFGGTDDGSIASSIAAQIYQLGLGLIFHVAVSPFQEICPEARCVMSELGDSIRIHRNQNLAEVFAQVSLFIGSPGTLLLEAIVAHLNIMPVIFHESHRFVAMALLKRGIKIFERSDVSRALPGILEKPQGQSLWNEIDGRGAERVAKIISETV
jgi:spore coat polysaccharide biosynthesis predicted glycosyltransferase SpsG